MCEGEVRKLVIPSDMGKLTDTRTVQRGPPYAFAMYGCQTISMIPFATDVFNGSRSLLDICHQRTGYGARGAPPKIPRKQHCRSALLARCQP